MLRKELSESGRQIMFRSEVATASNLRQLLNSGCRMLHFMCHGTSEFLGFESERFCGIMEPLNVRLNSCRPFLIDSIHESSRYDLVACGFVLS